MKSALLILFVLLSSTAQAKNYISCPAGVCPTAPPVTYFQSHCGANCYELPQGGFLDTVTLTDVQEDDISKPLYSEASDITACETTTICQDVIAPKCSAPLVNGKCKLPATMVPYCDSPDDAFYRQITDGTYEAYCARVTGYQKKTVKKLLIDAVKVAAKKAAKDAAAADESDKKTKMQNLKARLKSLDNQPDLTGAEVKELVQKLIRLKKLNKELD